MKNKNIIWVILLIIGLIPFIIGLGFSFINSFILKTLSFWENLIFYSFLFWPTYVIGVVLILLAIFKIRRKNYGKSIKK